MVNTSASFVPSTLSLPVSLGTSRGLCNRLRNVTRARAARMGPAADALRKVVLIDMDNTLVDFDKEFGQRWTVARPGHRAPQFVKVGEHFELEEGYNGPDDIALAKKIIGEPGFFIAFTAYPGAITAVKEMLAEGLEVYFCTSPHPLQYETCAAEKFAWIRKHFGEEIMRRVIITRDKTLVSGNVLIDDKPKLTGANQSPIWTHIIFDQPYNQHLPKSLPRLSSWDNWRPLLTKLLLLHPLETPTNRN